VYKVEIKVVLQRGTANILYNNGIYYTVPYLKSVLVKYCCVANYPNIGQLKAANMAANMYYCSIFVDQEYNHGLAVPSDSESLTGFN
jgi:hypothetical protein